MSNDDGKASARRPRAALPRRERSLCLRGDGDEAVARGLCGYHYAKQRVYLHAVGQFESLYVPVGPTRDRINALRAAGIGYPRLAQITGLSRMTLEGVVKRDSRAVHRRVAEAVLAVPVPESPLDPRRADGTAVPVTGTRRRLRALAAIGYSQDDILRRLGLTPGMCGLSKVYTGATRVTARRARDIAELYDKLQGTPGPSPRAASNARLKGWPPPLAWDEDTIDDPAAGPDEIFHQRRRAGRRMPADWLDMVVDRRQLGRSDASIAADFGITVDSLQRRLQRAGLPHDYRGESGVA